MRPIFVKRWSYLAIIYDKFGKLTKPSFGTCGWRIVSSYPIATKFAIWKFVEVNLISTHMRPLLLFIMHVLTPLAKRAGPVVRRL